MRVVILAAGAARRMGRPKQLIELDGRPLLLHALDQARFTGCPVDVVLGAEIDRCRAILQQCPEPPRILHNDDWHEGIAASVRLAVASAPPDCEALLLALCDQPRIPREHFAALVDAWFNRTEPDTIVASAYGNGIGAPAIFGRTYFADLLALSGDRGARALLLRERQRVHAVPCPHAEHDIDQPEDLAACEE